MSDGDAGDAGDGVDRPSTPDRTAVEGLKQVVSDTGVPSVGAVTGVSVYVKAFLLVVTGLTAVIGAVIAVVSSGLLTGLLELLFTGIVYVIGFILVIAVFVALLTVLGGIVGMRKVFMRVGAFAVLVVLIHVGFLERVVEGGIQWMITSGVLFFFLGILIVLYLGKRPLSVTRFR